MTLHMYFPRNSFDSLCFLGLLVRVCWAGISSQAPQTLVMMAAAIHLAPAECAFILKETRQLLQAVHGVVTGLSDPDQSDKVKQHALVEWRWRPILILL